MDSENKRNIERRIARLEGALGWRKFEGALPLKFSYLAAILLVAALATGIYGIGFPNHFYQVALAFLTIGFWYHSDFLIKPKRLLDYLLVVLNTAILSILFKLVIGGGTKFPFSWVKLPAVSKNVAENPSWKPSLPDYNLSWVPTELSNWSFDLTILQTFLLLVTILGAFVGFQPFISLTALALILVSIPVFTTFSWTWVFPTIVIAGIAIYLQTTKANLELEED